MANPKGLAVKSKIWIEDESGQVVFGAGRLYILQSVLRTGSIHAAAQELHMSYRAVWVSSEQPRSGSASRFSTEKREARKEAARS